MDAKHVCLNQWFSTFLRLQHLLTPFNKKKLFATHKIFNTKKNYSWKLQWKPHLRTETKNIDQLINGRLKQLFLYGLNTFNPKLFVIISEIAAIKIFGDTLEKFGDTQMCRDTRFEKHWSKRLIIMSKIIELPKSLSMLLFS